MERKNSSIILMVVGVVFVILAGAIFVTTAWRYMPEWSKVVLLLLTSLGFFGGSAKASKEEMEVTENVLFYLGTAFAGFFAMAATGGLDNGDTVMNAIRMMIANFVMLIPVTVKLMFKKKAFDFNVLVVLESGILFFGGVAANVTFQGLILLFSGNVIALAVADYFLTTKNYEDESMKQSIRIWYYIHLGVSFGIAGLSALCYTGVEDGTEMFTLIVALVSMAATTITYLANKNVPSRVVNSLAIMLLVYVGLSWICGLISEDIPFMVIVVIAYAIDMVIAVCTLRTEMVHGMMLAGGAAPIIQLMAYALSAMFSGLLDVFAGWFGENSGAWSTPYYPFSLITAGGLLALSFRNREDQAKSRRFAILAGLQAVVGVNMWIASKNAAMFAMVFWILVCTVLISITLFLKDATAKAVLRTIALITGLAAAFSQAYFEIGAGFIVEWYSFLVGIAIVLLGIIWYDEKEGISIAQFVLTCFVLGILLLNNLVNVHCGIINVLILGIVGVVILLTAVFKGDKKYAIASTVTLVLMALYITRAFWLSIAWWVYLFVAGLGLILLAIKKEREA